MKKVIAYALLIYIVFLFIVAVGPELRFYAAHPEVKPSDMASDYLDEARRLVGFENELLRRCIESAVSRREYNDNKGNFK